MTYARRIEPGEFRKDEFRTRVDLSSASHESISIIEDRHLPAPLKMVLESIPLGVFDQCQC